MIIPLGTSDWESSDANVPRLRLHNMYLIENPGSPDGVSRLSRPTLSYFSSIGSDNIVGMWQQDGTFGGDWLVVSGESLYRFSLPATATLIGTVSGDEFCQFAGSADRAVCVRNGIAYSTDGSTVSTIAMPDDVAVGSVAYINGYFLLSVLDSDVWYYIAPGETDPDPLSFFTAERSPDPIRRIIVLSDEIWLLGSKGPEVWVPTGDAEAPFQRVAGRVYGEGCLTRDAVVAATLKGFPCGIWVTDTRTVVLAQGSPNKISTESVDELLRGANNLRAWTFRHNRHDFYLLTADEFTLAFDITKGIWSRWDSYELDNFRGHLGLQVGSDVYAGDLSSNTIYRLEAGYSDDGDPVIRTVSGKVDITGKPTPCFDVSLRVNAGWSPDIAYEPFVELRWSDDQGSTFSAFRSTSLGVKGDYNKDVIFRSLGLMYRPGRVFEIRFSGPAMFRLDYAVMNEA